MGSCVSRSPASPAATEGSGLRMATAMVMDLDGSMARFPAPVTAREALALGDDERRRASCFVCSSDELRFDAPPRVLAADEPLQAGQLYFVLPLSMLRQPLSGEDMAALAVKASSALSVVGASSRRKNGDGAAGNSRKRKAARVAPLVAASSSSDGSEPEGGWNHRAYGKYGTRKTVHGSDETVGKARKGAGYRSGTRRRAGVQTLSVILEASNCE